MKRSNVGSSIAAGMIAAGLLAGFYFALVGIAQDFEHALDLMSGDWYFVIAIVAGFGVQIGLFVHLRKGLRSSRPMRSSTAITGAGTGTSTVSMVACCAHHLTDVLPIVGLSGAALFLNDYRAPLMAAGVFINLVGIMLLVRLIRREELIESSTVRSRMCPDGRSE